MRWLRSLARRYADGPSSQATEPQASPPPASIPRGEVSPTSPAVLLAKSLLDPETRSEWTREYDNHFSRSFCTKYRNEKRDLLVATYVYIGIYGGGSNVLNTPFTLNEDEQKIVREALKAFDRHVTDEKERAAMARLTCPALAIEAGTDETPKSGSTAKPRKRGPKATPND